MRDNFAGDTDNSVVRNLTQVPDWTSATSFDGFVFPCSFARGVYRAHGRDGPLARSRGVAGMEKARQFAILAHAGQTRRYTGEPYFEHPEAVAQIVATAGHTPGMLKAAYLHDVVEDTPVRLDAIWEFFGPQVAELVFWLSDPELPGNRAVRKTVIRNRWIGAPRDAKTIKIADLIHNSASIFHHDPKFAPVYAEEAWRLLDAIQDGDQVLLTQARNQIRKFWMGRMAA